eukprot:TRINITY_DN866_c0_g1_i1.p1 TRINITY_DN866_c0_g1~~TRINITY_DN866_c0_g1_i1.p1  ORF type:complete len:270 (+),score=41.54 TRINITY_DN866_c0_g1_i1:338-1147(+)
MWQQIANAKVTYTKQTWGKDSNFVLAHLMQLQVYLLYNGCAWLQRKTKILISVLINFFSSLYNCLKSNGRAVLQFYPDGNEQLDMITKSALKNGFSGGLIVDFPHSSKAKKLYLVLDAGNPGKQEIQQVEGLQGDEEEDDDDEEQKNTKNQNGEKKVEYLTKASKKIKKLAPERKGKQAQKLKLKSKQWIINKKNKNAQTGKKNQIRQQIHWQKKTDNILKQQFEWSLGHHYYYQLSFFSFLTFIQVYFFLLFYLPQSIYNTISTSNNS